ncbi:uncharacterized protein F5891DRAFT_975394 [Suillus fuscotomentosus]|uniref:Uncharacterized protein n=1 Tax=Suillus fuscotomentosus TaxID=1912939 RepID=A0AAD4HQR7_9AGAM|nr:uncharacterized protein F5891DRAFT_975394 [Suillus fuscotomentosus]KAG1906630.1 hypothetical protein F5891DRAFT_975394 [Suillus fuscotomentosus]
MSHHDSSCPSCGKIFKDHTSIACHMSQPQSGCNTWLEDMINSISPGEDHNMGSADDEDFTGLPRDVSYDPGLGGEENFHYFGAGGEDIPDGNEVHAGEVINYFPEPPLAYEDGYTFLGLFDADENSVSWLLHLGLSMGKIDSFLSLKMIKDLPLLFCSARELCGQAEMLPSGPCWKSQVIHTLHPTKSPVILYWHDPIEYLLYCRETMSCIHRMDVRKRRMRYAAIPKGATLLGTILSSDKTNITALTGDHVAHLLLISLSNIHMNVHLKSSTNSFVLAALLPVPKFIHKKKRMMGVLEDRFIHQCLNIVLEPLNMVRYCFTALASYITDTPEAMMLAAVGGKTSPEMMAMYKQFRDAFHHEPWMKSMMIAQLAVVRSCADPNDLEAYFREEQKFRLNGIDKPFWWDYALADPSWFLTPESLHHLHKEFFDHDTQWLIRAVGDSEIDFRFSVLQPITGYRHFYGGISKLKQVTGHCEGEIQRYIIAISADAAPPHVIAAVHALMQFQCRPTPSLLYLRNKCCLAADAKRGKAADVKRNGNRRGADGKQIQIANSYQL